MDHLPEVRSSGGTPEDPPPELLADQLPFVGFLALLLRRMPFVLAAIGTGAFLLVAVLVIGGRDFVAQAQFKPEGTRQNNLAGFAAQFGIDISGFTEGESVVFYTKLLKSRDLLKELGLHRYRFAVGGDHADTLEGTLLELYEIEGSSLDRRHQRLVDRLDADLYVSVDMRSEVVMIRPTAPWPELAEQIAARAIELVNAFNLDKRQSRGRAEREFVGRRLREAQEDLAAARTELQDFIQTNRLYQQSPELSFEASRLRELVRFREEVMRSLAQAYEEARIDEVRDTPVLTVIEQPGGSAEPKQSFTVTALLGALLGGLVGLSAVWMRRIMARQRARYPDAYARFEAARRDAVSRLAPSRVRQMVRAWGNGRWRQGP